MPFMPLMTAGIETALNKLLWQDKALRAARLRLYGKVLRITLQELNAPLVMVFSEQQLDVVAQWDGEVDCTVVTRLSVLPSLRDRSQLTQLIRQGDLEVQGDIQVVQNMVALLDLAETDPAEMLAPWTGDIVAEGLSRAVRNGGQFLKQRLVRQRQNVSQAITEEWRLAPGSLEVAWFTEEAQALNTAVENLSQRLEKLEAK